MKTITIALFVLAGGLACAQLPQKNYVLTNVNLFNGVDNKIYSNSAIYIKAGKIERIGKDGDVIQKEYEVLNCMGNYAIPGMLDVHTHIDNLDAARRALLSGVTTIRTAGVSAFQDVSLRDLARSGRTVGPDVVPAGVFVTPNLGESVLADPRLGNLITGVNTDEELRQLVNVNIDRGAEVIKPVAPKGQVCPKRILVSNRTHNIN